MRRFGGEKLVLIENEFGEIGIDGGFMREAGIQVNELNSGCICCSLVGGLPRSAQAGRSRPTTLTASSSSRPASASCPT